MRTFNEYREHRENEELAALIVEAGLDPIEFCGYVLEVAARCESDEELYNELFGGLRQLGGAIAGGVGRGVANAGRAVGGAAMQGAQAVGRGAQAAGRGIAQGAQAVGGAAMNAGRAVGGAVQQGAQAVGNAVGQGAQAIGNAAKGAGQWVGDQYQSGEMIHQMQNATKQVDALKQNLSKMGFASPSVEKAFQLLTRELQAGVTNVQGDRSQRFGAGSQVFGRYNTP